MEGDESRDAADGGAGAGAPLPDGGGSTEPAEGGDRRHPVDVDAVAEEEDPEVERSATNLELFLDLVFVFAVTQVAVLLGGDLTVGGFAEGVLMAFLVWWLWSQFAWLGTAVDLDHQSRTRMLVLATVPAALLMAVAIPGAYRSTPLQFVGAYAAVQLWALAIQGANSWSDPKNRKAYLSYLPLSLVSPIVLVIGGLVGEAARPWVWTAVLAVDLGAALAAGRGASEGSAEWSINASHFAERHSLFVIIALGEVLVATGASAAGVELTLAVGLSLVVAVTLACVLWWAYFAFVPAVGKWAVRNAGPDDRARLARDLFTFGHFPVVLGVVLYALVAKHMVAHPADPLTTTDLVLLALSIILVVGAFMAMHWQLMHAVAPERVVALMCVVVWCAAVGPRVAGVVSVAVVAVVVAAMQAVTLRRIAARQRDAAYLATRQ